jgi:hypothetical protein
MLFSPFGFVVESIKEFRGVSSHKERKYTFFESFYNTIHERRSIVENSFGRMEIHISMVFDIIIYCVNLHN